MATSSPVDGVRALAGAAASAEGLVVESVTITSAGRRRVLRVVVDLPDDALGGVPMEAVAATSRGLSELLDSEDVMGGTPYVLEVSSPGADRPLTERRHWLRARTRLVTAVLADGRTLTGRLGSADDDGVRIEEVTVLWGDLRSGRVELEFSRPEDPHDGNGTDDGNGTSGGPDDEEGEI